MRSHSKIGITPITKEQCSEIALALPLVLVVGPIPHQVANAQLAPRGQQALQSLAMTGFTNAQNVTVAGQNFEIKYSIK